jgi:hypothetical protein
MAFLMGTVLMPSCKKQCLLTSPRRQLLTIKTLFGHSNPRMTIYGHTAPDLSRRIDKVTGCPPLFAIILAHLQVPPSLLL